MQAQKALILGEHKKNPRQPGRRARVGCSHFIPVAVLSYIRSLRLPKSTKCDPAT